MRRFDFSIDPTAELAAAIAPQAGDGWAEVDESSVRITLGNPAMFHMEIPRAFLSHVERVPDLERPTRGVHGGRGRWLVNLSDKGLVRLRCSQPLPASLTAKAEMIAGMEEKGRIANAVLRFFLRSRTVKVHDLTIGLESPEGFVSALKS